MRRKGLAAAKAIFVPHAKASAVSIRAALQSKRSEAVRGRRSVAVFGIGNSRCELRPSWHEFHFSAAACSLDREATEARRRRNWPRLRHKSNVSLDSLLRRNRGGREPEDRARERVAA